MSDYVSKIKPAEIYSDLSADDIAEMMAEAAEVDALFKSRKVSTMFLAGLPAARAPADVKEEVPATAA
jgi:hypothetical protein